MPKTLSRCCRCVARAIFLVTPTLYSLQQEAGIDFARHSREGIRVEDFGELLMSRLHDVMLYDGKAVW
jgi:hypothetical protein